MSSGLRIINSFHPEIRTFLSSELDKLQGHENSSIESLIRSALPGLPDREMNEAIKSIPQFKYFIKGSKFRKCSAFAVAKTVELLAMHRFFRTNSSLIPEKLIRLDDNRPFIFFFSYISPNNRDRKLGQIALRYAENNDITVSYLYPLAIAPINQRITFTLSLPS